MKKDFHKFSKTVIAAALLSVPVGAVFSVNNVNAKTVTSTEKLFHYSQKTLSKKFAKAGYVFKLTDATKGALYKSTGKPYSTKVIKKIVKNNTLFKVKKVWSIHNGMFVDLVSKDGKYKGYTTYLTGIYNKNTEDEKLKPLVQAELDVTTARDNNKPTAELLAKAETLANELTGYEKKIALTSIKELKEFVKYGTMGEIPVLLIGKYPD
ncbi:hypothetical protein [uncultured Lactobacillus sp.]|uniref:hypothetical protein n=1 Tax=uncultured Lactobacillus sp. TaxID=153152 RepID=UPI0025FDBFC4|nr:hypothetical protein [uncultured Lactobacillus sp.]